MSANTEQIVISAIREVFVNKDASPPADLNVQTPLDASLGLESLDYAELVVRLEQETGKDPFSAGANYELRTVGDLAALYKD